MKNSFSLTCLWTLLTFSTSALTGAEVLVVSFSDGNFATPAWTFTEQKTSAACTITTSTQSSGGNPGAFRSNQIVFDALPKRYESKGMTFALYGSATWTPTSYPTAVTRLAFSWDERDPLGTTLMYHKVLIKQGSKYYMGGGMIAGVTTWQSVSGSVNIIDFYEVDPSTLEIDASSHPNFSSGTTMTFGFALWGDHTNSGASTQGKVELDNWAVSLYRS